MRAARKKIVHRAGRRASAAVSAAAVVLGVFAAFTAGPASAVVFPNLYTVTVMPDPAVRNTDRAAIDLAMRSLLLRLTGVRDPGADPALAALLANAPSYVSYSGRVEGGRYLVEFYSTQIEQALESAGRPFWGPERPLTLLWIAIDDGAGERVLLSEGGFGTDGIADTAGVVDVAPETVELVEAIREQIETVADERGLPIRFPLLDLEDMASMSSGDIWGGFVEPVEAASERYGADALLIGRISANTFGRSVQWTLVDRDERSTFAGTEVTEGLDWAADRYIEAYGFVGGARTVRLVVRDVWSFDDYGRVMSYLETLSALQSVEWDSHDGGVLSIRASARSDVAVLEQMLGLGRVLRIDDQSASFDGNTLFLRLASGSTP